MPAGKGKVSVNVNSVDTYLPYRVDADQQIATAQHIVQIARARVNVTMSKLSKKGMKKRT